MKKTSRSSILEDHSGSTLVEFALVAPMFFLMMFVIIEVGIMTFYSVAVESATAQVARQSKIGVSTLGGGTLQQQIRDAIKDKTAGFADADEIFITTNITSFDQISTGEDCSSPVFIDLNGNGTCDAAPPQLDLGGPGDIIQIRVFYNHEFMIPLIARIIGGGRDNQVIQSTTIIINEPGVG